MSVLLASDYVPLGTYVKCQLASHESSLLLCQLLWSQAPRQSTLGFLLLASHYHHPLASQVSCGALDTSDALHAELLCQRS